MERTRITLSVPWDPETQEHPAQWGWDVLLDAISEVHVVSWEDPDQEAEP